MSVVAGTLASRSVARVARPLESSFIGDLVDAVTNPVALLVDGPTREARERG
jgi:hypothetical protein